MKSLIHIVLLFITTLAFSQWSRSFRFSDDVYYENHIYKTVEIAFENSYDNTIEWKVWMLSDILIEHELDNLLDYRTQRGQVGLGNIISPVLDSIYFNVAAAHKVCPLDWRLPRIGEWDTLMISTSRSQKEFMFPNLLGYRSYSIENVGDAVYKRNKYLIGGYWWAEPNELNTNSIQLDTNYNYNKGSGDAWDRATVRCIREKY
jgi:uncharacterized protein (TIGR02145 family)